MADLADFMSPKFFKQDLEYFGNLTDDERTFLSQLDDADIAAVIADVQPEFSEEAWSMIASETMRANRQIASLILDITNPSPNPDVTPIDPADEWF